MYKFWYSKINAIQAETVTKLSYNKHNSNKRKKARMMKPLPFCSLRIRHKATSPATLHQAILQELRRYLIKDDDLNKDDLDKR